MLTDETFLVQFQDYTTMFRIHGVLEFWDVFVKGSEEYESEELSGFLGHVGGAWRREVKCIACYIAQNMVFWLWPRVSPLQRATVNSSKPSLQAYVEYQLGHDVNVRISEWLVGLGLDADTGIVDWVSLVVKVAPQWCISFTVTHNPLQTSTRYFCLGCNI